MPTRNASATWEGGLKGGKGSFKGESGAIDAAYSFGTRFENAKGSNPEELLAAAHAACFSMALAGSLEKNGTPSQRVETQGACTVEQAGGGFKVTRMVLTCRAKVDGIDDATFQRIAQETKAGCPVSGALAAIPDIQLNATLER